jgi:hypothetical protein
MSPIETERSPNADFADASDDSAELLMPSDVRKAASEASAAGDTRLVVEPPSAKLLVRLFLIPFLIVAAAVGVVFLFSLLTPGAPSFEQAMENLKRPGGGRTAGMLLGPASKQRYMEAEVVARNIRAGMGDAERVKMTSELADVLRNHTEAGEGQVRHFLLLALGRTWQKDPSHSAKASDGAAGAASSRKFALDTLTGYADDPELDTRKAAVLAMVYFAGHPEARAALPTLLRKLSNPQEDADVRIAAATALGPLAAPQDRPVIDALHAAMDVDDPHQQELRYSAALSLAQLNQKDVADTILKLLDRTELATLRYFDREHDPKNPAFRPLNDREIERYLVNTMIGAKSLDVPAVQEKLRWLAANDPSARVRATGRQLGLAVR